MLQTKLKKFASVLMLVSFIFGTAAPAAASPFITWSQFPNNSSGHPNRLVYNGTNWVKIAADRIVMSDANTGSGILVWSPAVTWGNNYNGRIGDSYESKIKNGTRLLTKGEVDAMGQAGRAFGGDWWTGTGSDKYGAWCVGSNGGIVSGARDRAYSRQARPVLFLKNIDANVYYLSAYSGGAKGALGAVTTAADSKSRMKFTYKDTTLAAPTIGGGALTLNGAGTSTWYTNTANRVAATVGNADPIAAAGYLFMKDAATATLTLGGAGTYTGEADLYLHHEIVGTNYDRMGTASTDLKSLGLKFTYASGKLTAMTLPELYGTEANAITLSNGFELTLTGANYAQNVTAAGGEAKIISNTADTTLTGNVAVNDGVKLVLTDGFTLQGENDEINGTLDFGGGLLEDVMTGNGTLEISGDTETRADIDGVSIVIDEDKTLNATSGNINGASIENDGQLFVHSDTTIGSSINNRNYTGITGGALTGEITNTGTIEIQDDMGMFGEAAAALQSAVNNAGGTITFRNNSEGEIGAAASITDGKVNVLDKITAKASQLHGGMEITIEDGAELILTGGTDTEPDTLESGIKLQGTAESTGILRNEGVLNAETELTYKTENTGVLTVDAGNIKNTIENTETAAAGTFGTLNLTGGDMSTTDGAVIGGGTVNINGMVKAKGTNFNSTAGKTVANLNIAAAGTLDLSGNGNDRDVVKISGNFSAATDTAAGDNAELWLDVDLSKFENHNIGIDKAVEITNGTNGNFDSIEVGGNATGKLYLSSINILGVPPSDKMAIGSYGHMQVVKAAGTNNLITFADSVTVTSDGAKYAYSQAKESDGAGGLKDKYGYLQVFKDNGYTLYEIVTTENGKGDGYDLAKVNTYALIDDNWTADGTTGAYNKLGEGAEKTGKIGKLNDSGEVTDRKFTIQANGHDYKVKVGTDIQTVTGIEIGASQTLNLMNAKEISGWKDYLADNAGTFNLGGRTGEYKTTLDSAVKGTGATNLTGNVELGANGSIEQKQLNIATGAVLNAAAGSLKLTDGIANAGTLTLAGGELAASANGITGGGTAIITGAVETENAITQNALTIADGASLNMTGEGKKLTVTNGIDNNGTLTIGANELASSVTNNGTVNVKEGTLGAGFKISGGDVRLTGAGFKNTNLEKTVNLTSDNATYNIGKVSIDGMNIATDTIALTDTGKAAGTLALGSLSGADITITNPEAWAVGTSVDVQYLTGGTGNTIKVGTGTAFNRNEYSYTFNQKTTDGVFVPETDSTWLTVTKSYAYKLWEVVRGIKGDKLTGYILTGDYDISTEAERPKEAPEDELGTLAADSRKDKSFTIEGAGSSFKGADAYKGITVADSTYTLTLKDFSEISGWKEYAVNNSGTFNLEGGTGEDKTTLDSAVIGDGTANFTGNIAISGNGKIEQNKLNIETGAVIEVRNKAVTAETVSVGNADILGSGKETSSINAGTLETEGAFKDITVNVTDVLKTGENTGFTGSDVKVGGNADVRGNLNIADTTVSVTKDTALSDGGTIIGNGIDKAVINSGTLTPAGDVSIADAAVSVTKDTVLTDGRAIAGNGIDKAVINSGTLKGIGSLAVRDITVNVAGSPEIKDGLNVEKDLSITNAAINVKTGVKVGGNVELDNAELSAGNAAVTGELTMANGSAIRGTFAVTGGMVFEGAGTNIIDGAVKTDRLDFYLDGYKPGDTLVHCTGTFDLSGLKSSAADYAPYGIRLFEESETKIFKARKEYVTLMDNVSGYKGSLNRYNPDEITVLKHNEDGSELALTGYKYAMYSEDGKLYAAYLDKGILERAKAISEGRMAGMAAVTNAGDLIADRVAEAVSEIRWANAWETFASVQGNRSRYETGSHVDVNGTQVAAGLAKKIKDSVTVGIFAEGGNSRYAAYNEFEGFGEVRSDGDVNYFGGGVMAKVEGKKTAKGQLHGEASFRAGHMSSDYNSETLIPGESVRYDTSGAYMGAHAAVGYKWALKDNSNIDTYVKYLWARQDGDNTTLTTGETVDFDSVDSHRLRAGFRYTGKPKNDLSFYGGLAYEYEFSSEAGAATEGIAIPEPGLKGGSGMAELGIKYNKANSPWRVELGLTGYTGKRDSIGANLSAWYEFGGAKKEKKAKKAKKERIRTVQPSTLSAAPRTDISFADIEQYKPPVTIDTTEEQEKPVSSAETVKTVKKITTERQPVKTEVKQETNKQVKSTVQIGSSQDRKACERLAAKAKKAGFDAKVTTAQKGGANVYRVRVFSDSRTPEALLKQVQAKGFDGFVVKD